MLTFVAMLAVSDFKIKSSIISTTTSHARTDFDRVVFVAHI